mmetsp:Transcript_13203/g.25999  ORF Transcript_13203/g.25999 Transcript_13203/m.25999 type:complete len:108 (-) Transcript_13203:1627-1950(-)
MGSLVPLRRERDTKTSNFLQTLTQKHTVKMSLFFVLVRTDERQTDKEIDRKGRVALSVSEQAADAATLLSSFITSFIASCKPLRRSSFRPPPIDIYPFLYQTTKQTE